MWRLSSEPYVPFARDMQDLTLDEQREYAREVADRTGRDADDVYYELFVELD